MAWKHDPLGKTGESFPILSFGAQRVVDEEGCTEDQADRNPQHGAGPGHPLF